ncbi:MAG: MerR family transcriptional regulator, partial [Clostridia bacterium]|nr:MerR family transcriptional regulator [Clostridia bacterium]
MTIKEVEERTGLSRSNVRFYEKEQLIAPARNESNGYRDYSESDIENIKKIAYLRTLGISIEDIRNVILEKATLRETIQRQNDLLKNQMTDLSRARNLCEKMLDDENIDYAHLNIEQYVAELGDYWHDHQTVFKLDSVSFLYIWGSFITWAILAIGCLWIAFLFYRELPPEIPVQWNDGTA